MPAAGPTDPPENKRRGASESMKYFAYGSNCNPQVMKRKGVEYSVRERATLPGYRLLFNKKAYRESLPEGIGFANINDDPEGAVEGVLYEIGDQCLDLLDRSERYPEHYNRIQVVVETDDGPQECFAYRAQPDKVAEGLVPSRNYLNHILAADDFLSRQYFEALDRSHTYTCECACCHKTGEVLFLKEDGHMYTLCQPCRESKIIWGDAHGHPLTVTEAEAVMTRLVLQGQGFPSIRALIEEAVASGLIGG